MSTCNVEELGIVLFEIPSNMILYRVGPDKWLTLQLFVFGIVSTFQAFQTDYASFISTRLLLGITEHGSIPGGLVDMVRPEGDCEACHDLLLWQSIWSSFRKTPSVWHSPYAWRWWQARVILAVRSHGQLHRGMRLHLRILFTQQLPEPRSTFLPNVEVFTAHEVHILNSRVKMHDPMKDRKEKHIGLAGFKKAVGRPIHRSRPFT